MDDRGLEEYKGEVDFDFFDDDDSGGENKPKKDAVLGKPPAARKSPKPPTPSKTPDPDLALDLKLSEKKDDQTDSDSYSSYTSDSSVTDSDPDGNQEDGSRNESKIIKSADSDNKNNRNKNISRRSASSSDDSVSKSYSESESETESFSKISSVQGSNDIKTKGKLKSSRKSHCNSSSASSDSDSDIESESKPVHVSSGSKTRERPMTSKNSRRKHNGDAWTNGSERSETKKNVKRPSDKESRKGRSKKERYSDSESEITDVSPLNSAPNSPKEKRRNKKNTYKNNGHTSSNEREESHNEQERLDLNVLVDAVSELDKDQRIKANTRRVMFAPPKAGDKRDNFSYSNERAKMIEKENRRLLNEILQQVEMRDRPTQHVSYGKPVIRRLTPSAINREREQRKIETENLAFLRRLKKIKPTRGMSKAEHEREYEKTMLYGVPISTAHGTRPKSRSSTPWDEMSMTSSSRMGPRTRSLSSVHSAASSSTLGSTQSTFRRPPSAKRSHRPEWNDRW